MFRFTIVVVLIALSGVYGTPAEFIDYEDQEFDVDVPQVFDLEGSFTCTLCEDIMKVLQNFLKKPANQASLIKWVEDACTWLPIFQTKCEDLVKEYGQVAVDLAVTYVTPALCKTFHVCAAGQQALSAEDNCRACQLGMGVLIDAIEDPELPERMREYTGEMCMDYFGSPNMCNALAELVADNSLPVARDLHSSGFLQNVCTDAEICTY